MAEPRGRRSLLCAVQGSTRAPERIHPPPALRTFAERAAFSGDLDRVLAALLAGHGRAVRLRVHALAEGAVVLLPLLLVSPQLVVDPAAGLGAVHRQQLHIWEDRRRGRGEGRGRPDDHLGSDTAAEPLKSVAL